MLAVKAAGTREQSEMTYPIFLSKRMRNRALNCGGVSVSAPTSWSRSMSVALEAGEAPADMAMWREATVGGCGQCDAGVDGAPLG